MFVNLGSFALLLYSGLNKFITSPIAIEISIISNFLFTNFWTFGYRKKNYKFYFSGLMFNIISIFSLGIRYLTFVILSLLFPEVRPKINKAI